jgi:hypothetical protein
MAVGWHEWACTRIGLLLGGHRQGQKAQGGYGQKDNKSGYAHGNAMPGQGGVNCHIP